jgi:hypothetical protein
MMRMCAFCKMRGAFEHQVLEQMSEAVFPGVILRSTWYHICSPPSASGDLPPSPASTRWEAGGAPPAPAPDAPWAWLLFAPMRAGDRPQADGAQKDKETPCWISKWTSLNIAGRIFRSAIQAGVPRGPQLAVTV